MPEGQLGVPRPFVKESTVNFMAAIESLGGFNKINFDNLMEDSEPLESPITSKTVVTGDVGAIVVGSSKRTFTLKEIQTVKVDIEQAIEGAGGKVSDKNSFAVTTVNN